MFCGQCGEFIPETNKFCTKCGAPLSAQFTADDTGDYIVVKTTASDVDHRNHREVVDLIRRIKSNRILVDFTNVTFIDSVGIGSLVTLAYSGARKGQNMKILIKSRDVIKSIRSLGVDNILELYETKEEAVAEWGITAG